MSSIRMLVVQTHTLGAFGREPNAEAIEVAMRPCAAGGHFGEWVGPHPRITRRRDFPRGLLTTVAWPVSFPDDAAVTNFGPLLQVCVTGNLLANVRRFDDAILSGYSPGINGPLSWWADGSAARTATRILVGSWLYSAENPFHRPENPVGPDSGQGPLQDVTDTIRTLRGAVIGTALAGVGVYALYHVVKLGSAAGSIAIESRRGALPEPERARPGMFGGPIHHQLGHRPFGAMPVVPR